MNSTSQRAWIGIENGTVLQGRSVGAPGEATGDLVFNTAMSGYQEILTDPSYAGQVVIMTYPLIGNYGVVPEDSESDRAWSEAFVMKEMASRPSNHRATEALGDWLVRQGVQGRTRTNAVMVGKTYVSNVTPLTFTTNSASAGWKWKAFGWPYAESIGTTGQSDPFGFISDGAYGGITGLHRGDHADKGDQIWVWNNDLQRYRYYYLLDGVPGRADLSYLKFRIETTEARHKMPELGRVTTHTEGVALITAWIDQMPDANCTPSPVP